MITIGELQEKLNGEEDAQDCLNEAIASVFRIWVEGRPLSQGDLIKIRRQVGFSGKYPEKRVGEILDNEIAVAQPA